jgi:hypothetical protein
MPICFYYSSGTTVADYNTVFEKVADLKLRITKKNIIAELQLRIKISEKVAELRLWKSFLQVAELRLRI